MEAESSTSMKRPLSPVAGDAPELSKRRKTEPPVAQDSAQIGEELMDTKGDTTNTDPVAPVGNGQEQTSAARGGRAGRGKKKDEGWKSKRRGTRPAEVETADTGEPKAPRLPKRQCALLIGFCGTGCFGMQIQPDVRTIEGVVFEALVKAGAVSQDNADDPVKVGLNRAARTDAGVHAAGNVVSMKMITSVPGVPNLVTRVNELLPPEIRLWNFVRAQNSFNARQTCDSRKYTYFFPSYMLIPPKPGSGLDKTLKKHSTSAPSQISDAAVASAPVHPFWADSEVSSTPAEDLVRKRQWRVGTNQLAALRAIALRYEGSHNFHNFTVGREFTDRSTQRFMKKIEIADPAVYGETEWISVMFHGQSFMLHQIRKMMCALVMSCRTDTPAQIIDEMFGPRAVLVPKMPALGLLLEYPIFESYNKRVTEACSKLDPSHADYRPPIDFEAHREAIDEFKQKYIYDNMRTIEDRDGVFDAWARHADAYTGDDFLYLNAKGNIPQAAVRKWGEKRQNAFKEKRKFDLTSFASAGAGSSASAGGEGEKDEDDEEGDERLSKAKLAEMEG